MTKITFTFEVNDDDLTSERRNEYRQVILDGLNKMRHQPDHDAAVLADKLLNDINRG